MSAHEECPACRTEKALAQRRERERRALLRDEFAGRAMATLLGTIKPVAKFSEVAEAAYAQADAMLAARGAE